MYIHIHIVNSIKEYVTLRFSPSNLYVPVRVSSTVVAGEELPVGLPRDRMFFSSGRSSISCLRNSATLRNPPWAYRPEPSNPHFSPAAVS